MHILNKNRNLIVWSDSLIIDGSGNSTGLLFTEKYKAVCKPKSGKLFSTLVHDNYICGQSLIFDRKVIQEIQFDSRLFYANDYKFVLELSKKYEFYFIEEPLVRYRIHEDSSIHKNRAIWKQDFFKISKYIIQDCGDIISSPIKAKHYNRIGQYLYERKHFQYANKYIVRSIYMNPQKTSYYRKLVKSYVKSLV